MSKTLVISEHDAIRLYPTSDAAMKELLELNFGKEFFKIKITDRVNCYEDILSISGVKSSADKVNIEGFNQEENEVIENTIRKLRACKVINEGWLPKRGERRYYNWHDVSSGFVFGAAYCDDTFAYTGSASRLCFKEERLAKHFHNTMSHIDKGIIGIKD